MKSNSVSGKHSIKTNHNTVFESRCSSGSIWPSSEGEYFGGFISSGTGYRKDFDESYFTGYESFSGATTFECTFCKKIRKGEMFFTELNELDDSGIFNKIHCTGKCCKRLLNLL